MITTTIRSSVILWSALVLLACSCTIRETAAFVVPPLSLLPLPRSELSAIYTPGRSSSSSPRSGKNNNNNNERSKRQFRVGELVRKELATILHNGIIKGRDATYLEEDLRKRISIVSVDVSPDLRQARVCVSIRNGGPKPSVNNHNGSGSNNGNGNGENNKNNDNKNNNNNDDNYSNYYYEDDPVVEKRRAFSWLVDNSGSLKHTLAQKLSHMKTSSPNLTFHQVDVAAATDVMYLIDKVSKGYKRDESSVSELHEFLGGGGESDDDHDDDEDYFLDDDDDDDWDEMDDDFFETE